jgi:hypothetical protein
VISIDLSACWSLSSSLSVDALIIPTKCVAGHYARSTGYSVESVGDQVCNGIPLATECSEGVFTSSSPMDGPSTNINLNIDGKSVKTYVLSRKSSNNFMHY